jgi:hypothetical protein
MQQIGLGTQLIDPACGRADDLYLPSSGGWKNGLFGIWFSVSNVKKSPQSLSEKSKNKHKNKLILIKLIYLCTCTRSETDDLYLPSSGGWKNGLFGIWFSVSNVKKAVISASENNFCLRFFY